MYPNVGEFLAHRRRVARIGVGERGLECLILFIVKAGRRHHIARCHVHRRRGILLRFHLFRILQLVTLWWLGCVLGSRFGGCDILIHHRRIDGMIRFISDGLYF